MGTSCNITILTPSGEIKNTVCHYDGYLSYTGNLLLNSWNTPKKILELTKFKYIRNLKEYPFIGGGYGEKDIDVRYASPMEARDSFEQLEYNYLWKNGKWYVTFHGYNKDDKDIFKRNMLLSSALAKEYKGYNTKPKKHDSISYLKDAYKRML